MAKQLIATIPDDLNFADLTPLLSKCIDFKILAVDLGNGKKAKRPGNVSRVHADITVPETIMAKFTPAGRFTKKLAQDWVMAKGYSPSSSGPAISNLLNSHHIKRVAKEIFEFVKPLADSRDARKF